MNELYLPNGSKIEFRPIIKESKYPGQEFQEILRENTREFQTILKEATQSTEDMLNLEDSGWIKLGQTGDASVSSQFRQESVKYSRIYYAADPLARQAIRLWTDYTLGSGISWRAKDERTQEVLTKFWESPANRTLLSAAGQRKSCDKLLVDGEIFFPLFLGPEGEVTVRRIDPLEISEIITDPDDIESVKYFKRGWTNTQGAVKDSYYRSVENLEGKRVNDSTGKEIFYTEEALVYYLPFNSIGQRGNPLLMPVLDWLKQYRKFLASRIAIMLALARFAWRTKLVGGQTAVDTVKAKTEGQYPAAGSWIIENMGADTQPIRTDSNARNAYDDGRMLKLQIAAGVGISEQYFADISTGNLATAKTVELPMLKQFQSFQQIWADAYRDIFNVVLAHNEVPEEKRFVDIDFPEIAPKDAVEALTAMVNLVTAFPQFADSPEVQKAALMNIGINNVDEVLDTLTTEGASNQNTQLIKALRGFRRLLEKEEEKK